MKRIITHYAPHSAPRIAPLIAAFIALGFTLTACNDEYGLNELLYRADDVNARSAYSTKVDAPGSDLAPKPDLTGAYTVLILSDIHFGAHPDHPDLPEAKFFAWLDGQDANKTPAFCLVLGDSAEAGTKEEYLQFKAFADKLETGAYDGGANGRKIPVYSVVGNHDLYNNGWQYYTQYCKPYVSYYHFTTEKFSWYALDSGSGTLGGSQLKNLISKLKADPKPKIIFSHYPMYGGGGNFYFSLSDPHERAALISAFAKYNVKIVLEGHQHPGSFYDFGSFKEYNVAAFRDKQSWHLLTVNEANGTVSLETFTE
ncbi:MAG: metallophosphoesterase [Treponema sp.]|jgi:3',5'-cyclic AMP phosphodiesterase CpdA|nr:metallophosphoesterase [Treponema sp.]